MLITASSRTIIAVCGYMFQGTRIFKYALTIAKAVLAISAKNILIARAALAIREDIYLFYCQSITGLMVMCIGTQLCCNCVSRYVAERFPMAKCYPQFTILNAICCCYSQNNYICVRGLNHDSAMILSVCMRCM